MPQVRRDLRDDEVIRFQRFEVAESAAATYTEQSYDTQLSIDRGLIWMIHWVEYQITPVKIEVPAVNTHEYASCQICRESQSGMRDLDDPDVVALFEKVVKRADTIGAEAGPLIYYWEVPSLQQFPMPLVYAAQTIHVGVLGTAAAAITLQGRIAYTLRKVTDKFFYRVAQALIS
jgi:hypothetical protein